MKMPSCDVAGDDLMIPSASFLALLSATQAVIERHDFCLDVLDALQPLSFGPVGLLAGAQATAGDAVEALCRYASHWNRVFSFQLERAGEASVLRLTRNEEPDKVVREEAELAMGVFVTLMRLIEGEAWRPLSTAFRGRAPEKSDRRGDFFGEVSFDQPFDGLTLLSDDLERANPGANSGLARLLGDYVDQMVARRSPAIDEETRRLIATLQPYGLCTVERVAQHLGVRPPVLHRRLSSRGLSFSGLVQEARGRSIGAVYKSVA
jgi:hypothetical protein